MSERAGGLVLELKLVLATPRERIFWGAYRARRTGEMVGPHGFDLPGRLVYTFRWDEPDPDDRKTVVTLSLGNVACATQVSLLQGEFATEAYTAESARSCPASGMCSTGSLQLCGA